MLARPTEESPFPVDFPAESQLRGQYPSPNLADAFAIRLPAGTIADPEALARFAFGRQAPWVRKLMRLRDLIMGCFGVKTSRQLRGGGAGRVSIFRIYAVQAAEIILGEDDKHLDFRLSVMHRIDPALSASGEPGAYLVVATVVKCHNFLGRLYIGVIAPFHRLIVMATLRGAARAGWPQQSG